jgi:SHS2 domain-containing protein
MGSRSAISTEWSGQMRATSRTEEHVGEWKVSLRADSIEELFAEAARVVSRACGPATGEPGDWEPVELRARDDATLLVDWLNELLGRSEVTGRAYDEVRGLTVRDGGLAGEVRGKRVRQWRSALKAATYHGLVLERAGRRVSAVVLFDV